MININLDHFQNRNKFLKKVTIDSKKVSTVEVNVSIFSEAVVGAVFDENVGSVVGEFFCSNDENETNWLLEASIWQTSSPQKCSIA